MHWVICKPGKADVTAAILEYKTPYILHRKSSRAGSFKQEKQKRITMADRQSFVLGRRGTPFFCRNKHLNLPVYVDIMFFSWSSLLLFDLATWEKNNN